MIKMEENSIMIIELKDCMTKKIYCRRCGILHIPHFEIQLTPSRFINVCTSCFEWARDKTSTEIRKDYKERTKRKMFKKNE